MTKTNFFDVVLVNTQLPENLGAVARSMLNFNLKKLRVVNPKFSLNNEKIIPVSAGAMKVINNLREFDKFENAIKDLDYVVAATNRTRSIKKKEIDVKKLCKLIETKKKIGVVFGPENNGLNNQDLSLCDFVIKIYSNPKFSSLNLSHAVIIICQKVYEYFLKEDCIKTKNISDEVEEIAKKKELIAFYEILERKLDESLFFQIKERKRITLQKIRNIFSKSLLTSSEIKTLVAIIKKISK